MDGFKLCRSIQKIANIPVIFLTVSADQSDVIEGLRAGGDDYMKKPFIAQELVLRVRAVLRRGNSPASVIEVGNLVIDSSTHEVHMNGEQLDLTPVELRFLRYLAKNSDRVVTVAELVREVWRVAQTTVSDPLVKTTVYRIRQKLDTSGDERLKIQNIRGVGYRLVKR